LPLAADPAVSAFLTREIEALLSPAAVALLRDTAVLPELTPRLAAALGGRPDARELLDGLFRAQALVRRAAGGEPVYVVHSLLRSHLLGSLAAAEVDAPARQHAAAARLLAERGLLERALHHALEAGDTSLTGELLRSAGPRLLTSAQVPALLRGLAAVPVQGWDEDLAALAVLARAEAGDLEGAERALALAERIADHSGGTGGAAPTATPDQQDVPDLPRVAQFVVRRLRAGLADPALAESISTVLGWQPTPTPADHDLDRELVLLVNRGQWQFATGRYDGAWQDLRLALDLATTSRREGIELRALSTLAAVPALVGQAAEAHRYVAEVLDRIERRGWATHPSMANVYAAGAWAASLMLLPHRAEQMVERAHAALQGNVDPEYATYTAVVDATLQAERPGDPGPAMALLARMAQGGPFAQLTPSLRAYAAMQRVRIMLLHGDLPGAEAAAGDLDRWAPDGADAPIARGQVHAARGRWAQCLAELRVVGEQGLPIRVPVYEVVHPMLTALASERLSQHPAAIAALVRSLDVAAPRGVVRPYREAGPAMRALLQGLHGRLRHHDDFVGTILERWEAVDRPGARAPRVAVDGVLLTQRELEVLRQLPTLMTADELATDQMVSVNTIRTHMRALYRKLGVRTRRDAVRRGRELGLL
jgi:LuxR family maltose regulon positive regulatory protein